LSLNPANAGRGSDTDGREQICKPASTEYEKISTGSCADRGLYAINEPELCEFAAIELGLADTSVAYISSTDKPEGCYFKPLLPGNALFLSTNPTNTGKGAVGGREPICSTIKPSSGGTGPPSGGPPSGGAGSGQGGYTGGKYLGLSSGTVNSFASVLINVVLVITMCSFFC